MKKRLKIKVAYDMVSNKSLIESKLTTADKNKLTQKLQDQVIEALTSEIFSIENIEVSLEIMDEGESELPRHLC
jgi:hypothetical protein